MAGVRGVRARKSAADRQRAARLLFATHTTPLARFCCVQPPPPGAPARHGAPPRHAARGAHAAWALCGPSGGRALCPGVLLGLTACLGIWVRSPRLSSRRAPARHATPLFSRSSRPPPRASPPPAPPSPTRQTPPCARPRPAPAASSQSATRPRPTCRAPRLRRARLTAARPTGRRPMPMCRCRMRRASTPARTWR